MRRTALLENVSTFGKLLFLLGTIILMGIVSAIIGFGAGALLFDASMSDLSGFIQSPKGAKAVGFLKIYQIINQVGIFILPAMFFSYFVSTNSVTYLSLERMPKLISILVAAIIIYAILPFNGYMDELNRNMSLPDFMHSIEQWMLTKEKQAKMLTEAFLTTSTLTGLFVNLIIVAVLPAIGEEMIFRGILLKLFNQMFKNIHIAVLVSSIIFSTIHLQFYGFLPRLILGMMLGYMFVFTGNLWVPIGAHFVNNASSAVIFYLHSNDYINIPMDDFGTTTNVAYVIGSLLISLWLMTIIYQREGTGRTSI